MLVLRREEEQSIMIGDDVEVKILEVSNNGVRLGITAPREIPVHRKEVYEKIHEGEDSGDKDDGDRKV